MTFEEATSVGQACISSNYPPTNPAVLLQAMRVLYLSQPDDNGESLKTYACYIGYWLRYITHINSGFDWFPDKVEYPAK